MTTLAIRLAVVPIALESTATPAMSGSTRRTHTVPTTAASASDPIGLLAALEQIAEPQHTTDPVAAGNGPRPGACRDGSALS